MDKASDVQRFRIPALRGYIAERRPVSVTPDEGTLGFLDIGTPERATDYVGAMFLDGCWCHRRGKPVQFEPTFWTVLVDG